MQYNKRGASHLGKEKILSPDLRLETQCQAEYHSHTCQDNNLELRCWNYISQGAKRMLLLLTQFRQHSRE
jgi:hypothetical protein